MSLFCSASWVRNLVNSEHHALSLRRPAAAARARRLSAYFEGLYSSVHTVLYGRDSPSADLSRITDSHLHRAASGTPAWTRICIERPAEPQRTWGAARPAAGWCSASFRVAPPSFRSRAEQQPTRAWRCPPWKAPAPQPRQRRMRTNHYSPARRRAGRPYAYRNSRPWSAGSRCWSNPSSGRSPHPASRPEERTSTPTQTPRPGGGGAAHPVETCCVRH